MKTDVAGSHHNGGTLTCATSEIVGWCLKLMVVRSTYLLYIIPSTPHTLVILDLAHFSFYMIPHAHLAPRRRFKLNDPEVLE